MNRYGVAIYEKYLPQKCHSSSPSVASPWKPLSIDKFPDMMLKKKRDGILPIQ